MTIEFLSDYQMSMEFLKIRAAAPNTSSRAFESVSMIVQSAMSPYCLHFSNVHQSGLPLGGPVLDGGQDKQNSMKTMAYFTEGPTRQQTSRKAP